MDGYEERVYKVITLDKIKITQIMQVIFSLFGNKRTFFYELFEFELCDDKVTRTLQFFLSRVIP